MNVNYYSRYNSLITRRGKRKILSFLGIEFLINIESFSYLIFAKRTIPFPKLVYAALLSILVLATMMPAVAPAGFGLVRRDGSGAFS